MEMLARLLLAHTGVHAVAEANNLSQPQSLTIEKFKQVANEQTSITAEDFIDLITLVYLTTPLQEPRDAVLEVALWHKKSLLESATFVTALSTRLELQPFANDFALAVSAISEVDAVENTKLHKHVSELSAELSKREAEYRIQHKANKSLLRDKEARERELGEKNTLLEKLDHQFKSAQGELKKFRNEKQNVVPQQMKLTKAENAKLDNHFFELQKELSSWQIKYQKLQKNNEMLVVDLKARERELKAAQEKLSKAPTSTARDAAWTDKAHKIGQQVVAFEEIKRCRNPSCNGVPTAKQKAKGAVQEPFRFYLEKSGVGFMARCVKCGTKHM